MQHNLECSSQLNPEALDKGFVAEKKEGSPVHLLLSEDVGVILAVRGALEVSHHLVNGPLADI